jgi:hypothetical protein
MSAGTPSFQIHSGHSSLSAGSGSRPSAEDAAPRERERVHQQRMQLEVVDHAAHAPRDPDPLVQRDRHERRIVQDAQHERDPARSVMFALELRGTLVQVGDGPRRPWRLSLIGHA